MSPGAGSKLRGNLEIWAEMQARLRCSSSSKTKRFPLLQSIVQLLIPKYFFFFFCFGLRWFHCFCRLSPKIVGSRKKVLQTNQDSNATRTTNICGWWKISKENVRDSLGRGKQLLNTAEVAHTHTQVSKTKNYTIISSLHFRQLQLPQHLHLPPTLLKVHS